jgi:formate hydrogenlyase transcriptional activator
MTERPLEIGLQKSALLSALEERDRLAVILDVSRAAASLALPELIERVATCLHRSQWRWDQTSLCLHDAAENALRVHSLFSAPGPLAEAHRRYTLARIPIDGTQSGRAFLDGHPCAVNTKAEFASLLSPLWASTVLDMIPSAYSSCVVPLTYHGRRLGTLASSTSREGAFDAEAVRFLTQVADAIAPAVDNTLAYRQIQELKDRLATENQYLEGEVNAAFGEVVGQSAAMQRVLALVESVACTETSVLISGETGTGKELIARAVHRLSGRSSSTFVKVNCAAIPTGLLESELFGHERGAFTGATSQKVGRFELAHGGTLFLDEVGEIPVEVQPKLLRVLQEQEFERLGGTRTLKVDARIIAATNRDLLEMVANRTFRSDLFYRLNIFPIVVPPLRERREDIPALVRYLVDRSAGRMKKEFKEVATESLAALSRYDWPGNVRELANVIERAVILSPGPVLRVSSRDLGGGVQLPRVEYAGSRWDHDPSSQHAVLTLEEAERAFIRRALEATKWVVGGSQGAARRLGLNRTTLQARMRKLGIVRPG